MSAVNEVRPPVILATLAAIVSFLPLMFIAGMLGPYMRPMAVYVPLTMVMSVLNLVPLKMLPFDNKNRAGCQARKVALLKESMLPT